MKTDKNGSASARSSSRGEAPETSSRQTAEPLETFTPQELPVEEVSKLERVKTTIYIDEERLYSLEELQMKLRRKRKRRITKVELIDEAIDLLLEHYKDVGF